METITTDGPVAVQPIPEPAQPEVRVVKCHTPSCNARFVAGAGFVPELDLLYKGPVDMRYPLADSRIFEMEICSRCAQECRRYDIGTFATAATLALMEGARSRNAERIERERQSRFERERRDHERSLAWALRREDDRGFVNEVFAMAKPHKERHKKPGQRYRNEGMRRAKQEPKPEQKSDKKKDKGDQQKSGKRKKR